ncbi:MAG TPA: hypothetical protein VGA00_06480 [Acidiferrobacterales bacterium]|jgi:hypothetical protein
MNRHDPHHETEVLASGEVCRVERCNDCGALHVHLGAVSIRLTPAAFESACATLSAARYGKREYVNLGRLPT